ncbi:MAG: hypothetical protein GYA26_04065, partial [Flexilinea flocculi]|nr:hypothetical protein [Flexilinea flocculi]
MPKIEIIPVHSINELSILLSENDCRIIAGGIAIRDEMGTVDSKIRKLI